MSSDHVMDFCSSLLERLNQDSRSQPEAGAVVDETGED
jgi:hypothetical protein